MSRTRADSGRPELLDADQEERVRAVLALGGVPYADLQDGVQQVRLRLLERLERGGEPPRNVSAWVAVVASNLAMDWHRSVRRRRRLEERLGALRNVAGEGDGGEETRVRALAVARALERLPDAQRQVVVLRFHADLSVRQIAGELGVPEGTVKSRLHAAVRSLRTVLHDVEAV
ncbi:RNA polymerase sigma factor [Streptomyces alkaliterrae]|uniref:Sigma-70 family RNA polymerase sigma factor n=1 Tax=Streptomyces alkaliterrae TaxID=2213162 RepID=A0A5P0YMH0_9ACTN|nr:sigma-70 family RNA polymerase sigma factor [Streptomyces alkaliterrae]MBB1257847.1 sigma-70 family RNA polymerase sigma factor [Streptomyces alkaliterrae]MQS01110.1 sigma-70 family RNA polymerase sigma factor [Streptomyces alkaliterrae]